jgi:hypothetical protein
VPGQRQEGGEQSTNIQSAGDVTIVEGASVDQVREIALDVFRRNFLDLGAEAADLARGRAERLTERFLSELERRLPAGLLTAKDPDMQYSLFNAQREFARSGEPDLETALVDLLVDRAGEEERSTRAVVLNEAITVAPKLSVAQRKAIATCFLLKYTTWRGPLNLDAFYELDIRQSLIPVVDGLPRHQSDYQHIEYVGAGAVGIGAVNLGDALIHQAPGCFTTGFVREGVPSLANLLDNRKLIVPCIRDDTRLQIAAQHEDDLDALAATAGASDQLAELRAVFAQGRLPQQAALDELRSRVPDSSELVTVWEESALKSLSLTSVGLAIGHGYWRRVTASPAPLSIWIPT